MVEYLIQMNSIAKEKRRQQHQEVMEEEEKVPVKKRSKRPSVDLVETPENRQTYRLMVLDKAVVNG